MWEANADKSEYLRSGTTRDVFSVPFSALFSKGSVLSSWH